jgi:glutamate-1-semialdehyde 2,1-aminomutase
MTGSVAGITSTGSKRPEALFGGTAAGAPSAMVRSSGCRVWATDGREYLDLVMALGAVALGYAHPAVTDAAIAAVRDGVVGPLPPALEEALASEIGRLIPWAERVRFLQSGAEGMAAAVRLARTSTGREAVLGCGYHGWLDWCQTGEGQGVPAGTRALYAELPFNDAERTRDLIRRAGDSLAAVVFEPVILAAPDQAWLEVLREETSRVGALLIADEIKTIGRLAVGGGCERWGVRPDLVVMGKAIANGFPLAAVGGRAEVMEAVGRTWISSTLATEWVSLAAAKATLGVITSERVPEHLGRVGGRLLAGLRDLAERHPRVVRGVAGLPEMCCFLFHEERAGAALAVEAARRGVLFKRSAYNFVSLAHDEVAVDRALGVLGEALVTVETARA